MSPVSKAPPLRLLFWETTARCNLACLHCRAGRTEANDASMELTTDEICRVLDEAAELGRPIVIFSGGEPLLREDWPIVAEYARSLGLTTALATNGTLIDRRTAGRIAAAGFHRVSVSLDGADATTHDEFRGVEGAFERAINGIGALREFDIPFQINVTVAAHNVEQLGALHSLAASLGAAALHLFLLVPVGCGVRIEQTHQLGSRRYERILSWLCEGQKRSSLDIRATCAPQYHRICSQRGIEATGSRGCLCGVSVCFISRCGNVYPCGYLPVVCGSVRKQSLAEVWRASEVFVKLRDYESLRGKCGRCEFKTVCGGCRARAFARTGDYLAADPTCPYVPPG